ncbi:expressed unknown protein [Seminavis robusta]|uniref:Uncharacterized protein n=1 Tax=Seminavis robusta TaxID=568900 RepID=A0A9N8ESZ9_9STRA|nr:expressed unknown protein [Seminavis robusta]|eukprot:Sro1611_g285890.1 n/a (509) ;mRNA; f:2838-4506
MTSETTAKAKAEQKGPMLGTVWWVLTILVFSLTVGLDKAYNALHLVFGLRALVAMLGYLIMQVGLWQAEFKWDEEGSAAYLDAAKKDKGLTPEELEAMDMGDDVVIPDDQKQAAFPTPWGFLIGWWVWGLSYIFPIDGTASIKPTPYGIIACVVCIYVSFVASVPMADAVMHRDPKKKMMLSLQFLMGWITLGVMSSLDAGEQLGSFSNGSVWVLCMMGPFTIILSQKILFASRKMGTLWEDSGKPNFHPIVYNMGGPLFVWGWFMFFLGVCAIPTLVSMDDDIYAQPDSGPKILPLFLNWRTLFAFAGGCAMVPVVRFLDYSHDEDGPWCGANSEGKVFSKWWLGTDGTYFGLFLESPWPFVIAWCVFGFSSFWTFDNRIDPDTWAILMLVNCFLQAVDAGILIQQNLYAGNMKGKTMFSVPFVILFLLLAINIGQHWGWRALALSLPGAVLIVLGQKTVFGARKRGDYTMQNDGKANPYDKVFVYTWGEVFFMIGWISISWGASMP